MTDHHDAFDPPGPDTPGRWRCTLCRTRRHTRWRKGTLRDAIDHYLTMHTRKETQK